MGENKIWGLDSVPTISPMEQTWQWKQIKQIPVINCSRLETNGETNGETNSCEYSHTILLEPNSTK